MYWNVFIDGTHFVCQTSNEVNELIHGTDLWNINKITITSHTLKAD